MSRPYKCIHCSSHRTVCKGYRKTKTMGKRRLRLCKDCGRKFTPRNQQPIDHNPYEMIKVGEAVSGEDDTQSETGGCGYGDDRYNSSGP